MSKIGAKNIKLPENVKVSQMENTFTVEGPKGKLVKELKHVELVNLNGEIQIKPTSNDPKIANMFWGTAASIVKSMIIGVTEGFKEELSIVGVGYKAILNGNKVNLSLGYSHPVIMEIPKDIKIEVPKPNIVFVSGIDKQRVSQFAALIRAKRPPEPYLGKGIKYKDEKINRKVGKAAGK